MGMPIDLPRVAGQTDYCYLASRSILSHGHSQLNVKILPLIGSVNGIPG